jgi:hypothetical protein
VNLAYVVVAGRLPYFCSGRLTLDSLRRFGEFDGRVVALSDRPWRAPAGVDVHVLDRRRLTPPALYKAAIRDVVPLHEYEFVVYLDADVLVRGSLDPFLQRARTRDFVCSDDMGNAVTEGYCGALLTPEERSRAATLPGANGGFFCARGERLNAIFDVWQAIVATRRPPFRDGFDQPALNAAILRAQIDADIVPDAMWFPRWHPKSFQAAGRRASRLAPLVHWNTITKPYHLARMAAGWARLCLDPSARR